MFQLRSITTIAALAGAAVLFACDSSERMSAPKSPSAGSGEQALVDHSNTQDFPYERTFEHPCRSGETITLHGTSHVITHAVMDGSGGIHLDNHFISDATGIGVPSMDEYTGKADNRDQQELLNITTVVNEDERVQVHGPNPGDNFFFHTMYHVTVNAMGVPTATVDKYDVHCNN
jgi:hypothetical protein